MRWLDLIIARMFFTGRMIIEKICSNRFADVPFMQKPGMLLLLCLSIGIAGCSSTPSMKATSVVNEYKRKHPSEYERFLYLNPVNLDTYQCMLGYQLSAASSFSKEVELKFGATPGVKEFCDTLMDQKAKDCQEWSRMYSELETLCIPNGAICQFGWKGDRKKEIGLLVIKNGDIVKRDAWIVDYLNKKR